MITQRKRFTEMLLNYLWAYILLIISQVVMYFYYPDYFNIYSVLLNYLYMLIFKLFDFFAYIITEVFTTYNGLFAGIGTVLICYSFYNIFMKIVFKIMKGGNK